VPSVTLSYFDIVTTPERWFDTGIHISKLVDLARGPQNIE